jgi:hypothetical protein
MIYTNATGKVVEAYGTFINSCQNLQAPSRRNGHNRLLNAIHMHYAAPPFRPVFDIGLLIAYTSASVARLGQSQLGCVDYDLSQSEPRLTSLIAVLPVVRVAWSCIFSFRKNCDGLAYQGTKKGAPRSSQILEFVSVGR